MRRLFPARLLGALLLALTVTQVVEAQPALEATTIDRLALRAQAAVAGELTVLPSGEQRSLVSVNAENVILGPTEARHATFEITRSPEDGPITSGRWVVLLVSHPAGSGWRPVGGARGFVSYDTPQDLAAIAARIHLARSESPTERLALWRSDISSHVERLRHDAAFQLATGAEIVAATLEDVNAISAAWAQTTHDGMARWLVVALGRSRHPRALKSLMDHVSRGALDALSSEIVRALARFPFADVRAELASRLPIDGVEPTPAQARLTCLGGRLGMQEMRSAIEPLLQGVDERQCCLALEALTALRDPASIDVIAARLTDSRVRVRRSAAIALASYRSQRTIDLLSVRMADESDAEVRYVIRRLLEAPAYYLAPLEDGR